MDGSSYMKISQSPPSQNFYFATWSVQQLGNRKFRELSPIEALVNTLRTNLGTTLKTEHILKWMADPLMRKRTRKGLLKTEQVHQLARDITYGNRGRLKGRGLEDINSSGNCTANIIAAITCWQSRCC
jgi:TnpA family transposase